MSHNWENIESLKQINRTVYQCLNCSLICIIDYDVYTYILNGKYFNNYDIVSCGEILMQNVLE